MKALLVAAVVAFSFVSMNTTFAEAKSKKTRSIASESTTFTDTIKKIRDDDEGVVVLFNKTTGSYYLRRDVADFEGLKKKLDDAFTAKKPVSVTFDAAQLNILEVK